MQKGIYILGVVLCFSAGVAMADVVYKPLDKDIFDLDHYYAFEWGIDLGFSTSDTPIVEAYLEFDNISNWWYESYDILYVDLLEGDEVGLMAYRDRQAAGDYFDGQGFSLFTWSDDTDRVPSDEVFALSSIPGAIEALNLYGMDGIVAVTIDPDCHYWNDGVQFRIVTAAVPAPGAIMLGSVGLLFVGWLRTRKVF